MDLNKSFKRDWLEMEKLVRAIYPEVNGTDLRFIKERCKYMVTSAILEIGNGITNQTSTIED